MFKLLSFFLIVFSLNSYAEPQTETEPLTEEDLLERFGLDALVGADLKGVYLGHAKLEGADLRYAKLSWAILTDADLAGADLRGAKLEGADLRGVTWSRLFFFKTVSLSFKRAFYNQFTVFPDGFDPKEHGMRFKE